MIEQREQTPIAEAIPAPIGPGGQLTPMSMREVLRIPVMRRLWYAQIVSVFGDFLALFAVILVMTFNLHATPQQITGIQIAYMGPIAILGILSGVFVDRWPVKITLVSSDFIRAGLCFGLIAVHSVWGYYISLAAISVVSSFFSPAQGVAVRSAVPWHGQGASQALMQQVMMGMRIVGGPLATILVHYLGPRFCYSVDSLSFIASGTLIATLAITLPGKSAVVTAATPREGSAVVLNEPTGLRRIGADMQQGISFIVHHAALLFVILALASGMFVLGCFGPLIAVYVRDILHAPETTFGKTSPMIPLGMVLGMNLIMKLAKTRKATELVYFGLGGIGIGTLLLALFPHLYATIPGLAIIGFAAAAIIIPAQTLIAQETPPPMMGRVGSTVMSAIFTAQILGLILSGILTEHTSVRRVFALCTAMLVVLMIVGKLFMEPKDPAPKDPLIAAT
jgi:DHA3 family macrolide efflux protein-like MFS transporter